VNARKNAQKPPYSTIFGHFFVFEGFVFSLLTKILTANNAISFLPFREHQGTPLPKQIPLAKAQQLS
jgi:hypothetical protein